MVLTITKAAAAVAATFGGKARRLLIPPTRAEGGGDDSDDGEATCGRKARRLLLPLIRVLGDGDGTDDGNDQACSLVGAVERRRRRSIILAMSVQREHPSWDIIMCVCVFSRERITLPSSMDVMDPMDVWCRRRGVIGSPRSTERW